MSEPQEKFKCKKCRTEFSVKKNLDRHLATIKDCVGVLYTCKRCLDIFDTLALLRTHQTNDKDCIQYVFENRAQRRNRVINRFNIKEMGFKKYIHEILTPVSVAKELFDNTYKYELIQNTELINLVFDSLTTKEFIELIRIAGIVFSEDKINLINALKQYLPKSSPEKSDIIKTYFEESHIISFR